MSRRKKKARVLRRSFLLALGILIVVMLGVYLGFGIYFQSHFFFIFY